MTTPKVSVLMPVLNGERYVDDAIGSITAQTYRDFEFLVVDDGSTDRTPDMLRNWENRDSRIRILRRDREGLVPALNAGIEAARGEYLARMDDDDIALSQRFDRQVAALDGDPEIGVLGSYVEGIDDEGRPIRTFRGPCPHEELDDFHLNRGGPRLWHPSVMMRTEILRRIGGYSAAYPYTEDYDLWLRMGEVSRLATYPEVLLRYRLHLRSVSVTKSDRQVEAARRAQADAFERRGLNCERDLPRGVAAAEIDVLRKWGWWAFMEGNLDTAQVYALKSLRRAPFSKETLRLCYSVLRERRRAG